MSFFAKDYGDTISQLMGESPCTQIYCKTMVISHVICDVLLLLVLLMLLLLASNNIYK